MLALRVASAFSKTSSRAASWRMAAQRPASVALFSTKYTKQHEYITLNGKEGTIGITDFAQNSLGDVVFVDLPAVGDSFAKGSDVFGAVESVKAASDVYLPASGKIIAVNEVHTAQHVFMQRETGSDALVFYLSVAFVVKELGENPHLVNEEAMSGGWFVKIEVQIRILFSTNGTSYPSSCCPQSDHVIMWTLWRRRNAATAAVSAARALAACRRYNGAHVRCIHSQQLVREALQEARKRLQSASTCGAATTSNTNDAKPLLTNALRPPLASSNDVFLHLDRQLTSDEAHILTQFLERRCNGEPLAYIIGKKEFWSLEFRVSPSTLIPRSDSEVLIETLVEQYPDKRTAKLRILDLGTGSGCLLLSALSEFPLASGVGLDISADALEVARANAAAHGLTDRAQFVQYDMQHLSRLGNRVAAQDAASIEKQLYQQLDVILCNPPYIPRDELHLVADDVLAYEPHLALFSDGPNAASGASQKDCEAIAQQQEEVDCLEETDPEGLRMYRYIQQSVVHLFRPDGRTTLLFEIGSEAQAKAVQALFAPSSPALTFERMLIDGQGRHRGLLFQGRRQKSTKREGGMKESLAARQAALLKQNAELNEQVEAIEQRRQQQLVGASTHFRGSSSSAVPKADEYATEDRRHQDVDNHDEAEQDDDDAQDVASSRGGRGKAKQVTLKMDLTKSEKPRHHRSIKRQSSASEKEENVNSSKSQSALAHNGQGDKVETPEELGMEAAVRYQKARLRVLQDEADSANAHVKELEASRAVPQAQMDELKAENGILAKKSQQTQQLLEKQKELSAAQEAKQRLLESQLAATQAKADEIQRSEKQASQQFRSKDVRLNRALEELEKVKAQLQQEKKALDKEVVTKSEYESVVKENKKLEKQKSELLVAFKKQMKLIDLLKRQRIHMEAAKMLSFTEEEFSKTLELG
ncbi:Methylase of polypeptide chain release factor, partial [Globisporangium splendens]